ncbi:MAG: D-alanyl-D-alanine carboxypeptidase family protein [Cyclobacteriaceae bacterium]
MKKANKLKKLVLADIQVLDLEVKDIGSIEKITIKTTDLASDILPQGTSLNGFFAFLDDYNGKYDTKADQFTSDAKTKYVAADKEFYSRTKSNMTIYSGKRSVQRQAELYVLYKWHNQGNPASWPGCSFHNWGVAADMVRVDEKNVVESMNKGGWTRTVDDEGWHFECTSSGDHSSAAKKISELRKSGSGLAYKWSEQVANFYLKSRDFNKRAPVFNKRLENHRQAGQVLQKDVDKFNQAVANLRTRVDSYNKDVKHFNNELARANRMVDEINGMPNGPERERKIREFRNLEAWLNNESSRLEAEGNYIDAENNRLSSESASLDRRIKDYQGEDAWLNKEYKELTRIESEIPKHEANANDLLAKIESAVS